MIARFMLFALVAAQLAPAQTPLQPRIERVEKGLSPLIQAKGAAGWSLPERMKFYKVPGVSIAVINDFKVEWARAYGVKDVETNEPVTTETLFQAGSISKPVAAMTALKKVEQGKLALDQNINDKLTSWKLPDNEYTAKRKVTLANLLSHTGGLTVHGFPGYAEGKKIPTVPQVLDGVEPANTAAVRVNMEPGTRFRYSGGGTTIAQLAIMDIEKKPFPQIAEETVLGPLGMTSSTYSQPLPDGVRKKAAAGHRGDGKPVAGKIHVYPEMAAAGLWTTPTDLARFAIETQLSLAGKSNKVLSPEMTAKMMTPFINDSPGLGFFIQKHGAAIYFGHGGADEGFRAELLAHKEKGYGVAVMVNSDNGQIIPEIIRAVAKEYQWEDFLPPPLEVVTVDPARLDAYTGRFQVNPDRVLTITRENDKLYIEHTLSPKVELFALSANEFARTDANLRYSFQADSAQIKSDGQTTNAKRIGPDVMIPYEKLQAGKYAEAIAEYKKIKQETPNHNVVAEGRLNSMGYTLLSQKKIAAAIAIFQLNVEFYLQSANTYDSLGEAYMQNGEKEQAIANYKKSLELDPQNNNAVEMLKKLGQR
jgi:CubicO group peptidase (beta-lactamase class C family)